MVNTVKIRTKDTEDYSYEIDRKNNLPGSLKKDNEIIFATMGDGDDVAINVANGSVRLICNEPGLRDYFFRSMDNFFEWYRKIEISIAKKSTIDYLL